MATTTVASGNPTIDTITTIIDDLTGMLLQRSVHFANGVVAVAQFDENGMLVSRTLTDPGNSAKWASKTFLYENGEPVSESVTFDNGVVKQTRYEAGQRVSTTFVDHDNTQSYQWIERTFDPETGKLALTRTLNDSGIMLVQAGHQGHVLESTERDESLHGGRGEDVFVFAPGSGHDKIAHFTQGQDRLDLTGYGIFSAADLEGKVTVHGRVTTIQLTPDDSIKLIGYHIGPLTDADLVSDGVGPETEIIAAPDVAEVTENGVVPVDVLDNDTIINGAGGQGELQIVSALAPAGVTATPDDGLLVVDTGTAFDSLAEGERTTFDVTYTVSDGAGHFDDAILTVSVTGVNDAPEFTADSFSFGPVSENLLPGAVVGQVSASDVDSADSQYYEFANGTQMAGAFGLDRGTGVITTNAVLDYETAQSHALEVVVRDRDNGGLTDTATVNVTVGDLPDTADPLYAGQLTSPGTVTGSLGADGEVDSTDPAYSDYWQLALSAGQTVSVQVNRLENDFDPSLWVIAGVVTDPVAQFGSAFETSDPGVVGFADDEIPHVGPFGDPFLEFTAATAGDYTIVVTNYLSGPDTGGDGVFDYSLIIA